MERRMKQLYLWKRGKEVSRKKETLKTNMMTIIRARGLNTQNAQDQRLGKFDMGRR